MVAMVAILACGCENDDVDFTPQCQAFCDREMACIGLFPDCVQDCLSALDQPLECQSATEELIMCVLTLTCMDLIDVLDKSNPDPRLCKDARDAYESACDDGSRSLAGYASGGRLLCL